MLFVSDLDGTLLQNDASLSRYARELLSHLLLEREIPFTVATARGVGGMRPILQDLPLKLPVIAANGAFISDYHSGRHHFIHSMDIAVKDAVFALISRHGFEPIVSTHNDGEDRIYYTGSTNEGMGFFEQEKIAHRDRRLRKVFKLDEVLGEHVINYTLIDRRENLIDLEADLVESFPGMLEIHFYENVYAPGWYMFTVLDRLATKSQALERLMELSGVSAESLTVFGDNLNDISMFRLAGTSVAVGNAKEELKVFATHIIGSNTEDSVVKYLNQFW